MYIVLQYVKKITWTKQSILVSKCKGAIMIPHTKGELQDSPWRPSFSIISGHSLAGHYIESLKHLYTFWYHIHVCAYLKDWVPRYFNNNMQVLIWLWTYQRSQPKDILWQLSFVLECMKFNDSCAQGGSMVKWTKKMS